MMQDLPDHQADDHLEPIPRVSGLVHAVLFSAAFVVGFIAGVLL